MRPQTVLLLALALSVGCFTKSDDTAAPEDTGEPPVDADGDGHDATVDCDDSDPAVFPGADELCNGIDDDCDAEVDESDAIDATAWLPDTDGDGYGDRNTAQALASCEPVSGHVADATDCDDGDAEVNPAADELCNGVDDDCDGEIDADAVDAPTWYLDYDDDGYGGTSYSEIGCEPSSGYVADNTDCDDLEVGVNPGADEDPCNGTDDDCDGDVDEADGVEPIRWYMDNDGDGYGNTASHIEAHPDCDQPSGTAADDGDCDDSDSTVYPGADEWCDGFDNDCDGVADEGDAVDALPWYEDADGDGYGWFYDPATMACTVPPGFVADDTDCDDSQAGINPGTTCAWGLVSEVQTGVIPDGSPVTVVGWAMHDAISSGFYLADAAGVYNGVWVYANSSSVLEGDELVVSGTVAEYFDLTEIVVAAPSTDIIVLDTGATLPAATPVATTDLADDLIAERYEGVLVTISGVDVEDSDLGNGEWSVDDGVVIDDALYAFTGHLAWGGSFTSITGLLTYSYGAFKILPRYAADLVGYTAPVCTADACVDDLVVGDLVITEIMYNPAYCDDSDCEWFELYNASGGSVDLDGLTVEDAGGNTATVLGSAVMAAGSTIVVAIGDSATWAYTGFTPDGYYGSTVALGNTGDQLMVANGAGILDSAAAYASGATGAGESLSLHYDLVDVKSNDDPGNWCVSTTAIGATGDYGTPGATNDSCL